MIKLNHDEIMKWYGLIQQFNESGMGQKEYCDAYEIDYRRFCNMRNRIVYNSQSKPALYNENILIARRYLESEELASTFCQDNGISLANLRQLTQHLGYLDIIESKLEGKKPDKQEHKQEESMSFHKVSPRGSLPLPAFNKAPEHEIIEARNNVELVITKGVKVIVSPEIGTEKLIKIIELLKDL